MSKIIGIFTGKDLNRMKKDGGTGFWRARAHRIQHADYAIFVRNHRESWAAKDDHIDHGQVFMIAKVGGCDDAPNHNGRKIIKLSDYALLPNEAISKKAWSKLTGGQRYPVAYLRERL